MYVQSRCIGGPNDGLVCGSDLDCPTTCLGGVHDGQPCQSILDCGVGSQCEGVCVAGQLGTQPVYLTAAQWGTVGAHGEVVRPSSSYLVQTECLSGTATILSGASDTVTTWRWGETTGDTEHNVNDVIKIVDFARGLIIPTLEFDGTNLWPCEIDETVNVLDITGAVDALRGLPFPCDPVCP